MPISWERPKLKASDYSKPAVAERSMLYDKKWDRQVVVADPFKLSTLTEWLGNQSGSYRYVRPWECLLAQYFKAHDFTHVFMGTHVVYHGRGGLERTNLPPGFDEIARQEPYTFEAAYQRALAA